MSPIIWIILGLVILFVLFIIGLYNSLVVLRQKVRNSWSQIEVQLQRRFDLIPNLVDTVKGYMAHEEGVLVKLTEMRAAWSNAKTVNEKSELNDQLSGALKSILAISENYPDLKASTNFSELQGELQNTENKISFSRQFYNDSVTRYNIKLEVFPSNLIAPMFGFKQEDLFKTESEEAKKNVKVDFNS